MPERLLLCTDLDRTLIPNGPQPESPGARAHFAALVADTRVKLAYVTGRHRQLVEDALAQYHLPLPDFVIGDVGTSLYRLDSHSHWRLDASWDQQIGLDWNGRHNGDLQAMLAGIPGLSPQEASRQNSHKVSYYVAQDSDRAAIELAINQRLQSQAVRARMIWSADEQAAVDLLDILPSCASKYHAIAALQQLEGFTDYDTVFSGDSGNDLEVLASSIPAVLVANSEPAVQAEALRQACANSNNGCLYIARGNFYGMNGNYSAGILEGIAHYHPDVLSWTGLEAAT
jgi:HAD superfamily hydrolase (TIGR01484 family)